jgi:hypothetical protein
MLRDAIRAVVAVVALCAVFSRAADNSDTRLIEAIKSDNLTKKDVKDIKEIDSGTPANDMHDVKIKDAMTHPTPEWENLCELATPAGAALQMVLVALGVGVVFQRFPVLHTGLAMVAAVASAPVPVPDGMSFITEMYPNNLVDLLLNSPRSFKRAV